MPGNSADAGLRRCWRWDDMALGCLFINSLSSEQARRAEWREAWLQRKALLTATALTHSAFTFCSCLLGPGHDTVTSVTGSFTITYHTVRHFLFHFLAPSSILWFRVGRSVVCLGQLPRTLLHVLKGRIVVSPPARAHACTSPCTPAFCALFHVINLAAAS